MTMIRPITGERVTVWLLAVLLVAASVGIWWVGTPYTANPAVIEVVEADPAVELSSFDGGYVLAPTEDGAVGPSKVLAFYPGARVDPSAYLPVLAPVVEQTGATVYVPRPTLNLAVFDQGMAKPILATHPEAQIYVGGHSLGGAMACRFADRNGDRLSGLVLFGSYCDRDLSKSDLRVLSVEGSADTVIDRDTSEENRKYLPNRTLDITIDGLNHTQFGAYSGQPGDSPATISYTQAHERLADALVEFLTVENGTSPAT